MENTRDSDGDGIADAKDKCPNEIGVELFKGCPDPNDSDGDGVPNSIDGCPGIKGSLQGCPDSDKDSIADKFDSCRDQPGPASNKGCPEKIIDLDGDGVADSIDRCPDKPGLPKLKGCPDKDADGIADIDDKCPEFHYLLQPNTTRPEQHHYHLKLKWLRNYKITWCFINPFLL